ncbi:MAG: SCP2 sterol-binding domain-containing protein [Spirochaetota bacterium]|nr:SCP2 sterol-binding domain-containing protein [Spirochaetota bacterium]
MKLYVPDSNRLNLLGHFLVKIISTNCEKYKDKQIPSSASFLIIGSNMKVLLAVKNDTFEITESNNEKVDLSIKAELKTFLDIALGKNIILPFLSGKIKLKGNPTKILPLIKWLKV